MSRGRHLRGLSRRGPVRDPKIRLVIICEGENTEPQYLKDFARHVGNPLVEIEVVGGAGVPMTLVDRAIEARRRLLRRDGYQNGDMVWAVFDRDEHPQVADARARAAANHVHVAYSNPCFELWLILHFEDFDAPDDRHQVQYKLAGIDRAYDAKASKIVDFNLLAQRFEAAVTRARRIRQRRIDEGDAWGAPYTDVDCMMTLIHRNGK